MEKVSHDHTKEKSVVYFGVPAKTLGLVVVLATITGLLVFYAMSPQAYIQQNESKKVAETIQDTSLFVEPAIKYEDATYSSTVSINTNSNKVTAVQLELSFDPLVLKDVEIFPMDFFTDPIELIKTIDEENGRVSYAISIPQQTEGIMGAGNLAKISYNIASKSGQIQTYIKFLPKTEVSSENTTVSVLKETQDGIIDLLSL